MEEFKWRKTEKGIARAAYDKALRNECSDVIDTVKQKALKISEPREVWELEKYLRERRREIDSKYDYRYSALPYVFGRLVREGWITMEDLEGLGDEKRERIKLIATAPY